MKLFNKKFRQKSLFDGSVFMILLVLLLASGCSTTNSVKHDPLEPMNRAVFKFNEVLDDNLLKPIAETYKFITPDPVETGVSNFFNNIGEINTIANDVFQFKFRQAGYDFTRFAINSTIGIFGVFDVASNFGMKRNKEDFGQTLGYWGIGSGPYLVLPFFGPSSLRDAPGLVVDQNSREQMSPIQTQLHHEEKQVISVVEIIDKRAGLLRATQILDAAAKDKYVFIRESYLQQRKKAVEDGQNTEEFEIDVQSIDF